MKRLLVLLFVMLCPVALLQGQGTISFTNAPVYDAPELDGAALDGTNFFGQLYAAAGPGLPRAVWFR